MSTTPTSSRPGGRAPPSTAYTRRKPTELPLPSGEKVLVALPEDADALRQKHRRRAPDGETPQIEVIVYGSEQHHTLLREAHSHHTARRDELRARHGLAAVLDEWDGVCASLDGVEAELERLVDHAGALRENFSRFGYDAQVRTYGEGEGGGGGRLSRAVSEGGGSGSGLEVKDWDDREGVAVSLFKRPVVKQYFHRGLLWRSSQHSEVMPYELFFDLLFVGIIEVNGEHVSEVVTGKELLRFVITFCMSWKIWSDITNLIEWFETDDVMSQLWLLLLFSCLLGLTTNMTSAFGEEHDSYVQLAGYYITARLFGALWCCLTAYLVPMVRGMMFSQVIHYLVGIAFIIASTQVSYPSSLGLIITGLVIDLGGSFVYFSLYNYGRQHESKWANRLSRFYDFYPAVNIEHKVERINAFVCLVIGYGVVVCLYQNQGYGLNAFLGKAVLGLTQGYIFNWLYFEIDNGQLHVHAIRRHPFTATVWHHAHLIFIMSYIISCAALSKLVIASDSADADPETLTPHYAEKSEPHIDLGLRLFYCVGLGLALAVMLAINLSHEHKVAVSACRIPHWARLANRAVVCVVLCCLPAAGDRLNSLHLGALGTGLSAWVLAVELVGRSCRETSLFGGGGRCGYAARCSRRELDEAMKSGGDVEVRALGRSEKTAVPGGLE